MTFEASVKSFALSLDLDVSAFNYFFLCLFCSSASSCRSWLLSACNSDAVIWSCPMHSFSLESFLLVGLLFLLQLLFFLDLGFSPFDLLEDCISMARCSILDPDCFESFLCFFFFFLSDLSLDEENTLSYFFFFFG